MTSQQSREINRIPLGMRPGRRELNEASLVVSLCEAVPAHMREKTREITCAFVEPAARRTRLATALLNFICQEADANGITLLLTAQPCDDQGPPEDVLVRWYGKFGFTPLQDTPVGLMMARAVHAKPKLQIVNVGVAVRQALASELH